MSQAQSSPERPDLTKGVASADVVEGGMLVGKVGEDEVLLARTGGELFAVAAKCTHYQGPLEEGLIVDGAVRCPWHHARFCLRTGEALGAPAIDPLARWTVREADGRIAVDAKVEEAAPVRRASNGKGPRRVVIAGGGAAGFAAAERLRRNGFDGALTLVSADAFSPYDRPNCSKDYLAGEAPAEWMPLRADDWYPDNDIDLRLGAEITALDLAARTASLKGGGDLAYDALVLAMGAEPRRPPIPGFDQPNVHVLRGTAEADAIAAAAGGARRVVIVGASFIGLEVAAALRHRGLEVHVAAPEAIPLERPMGKALGHWVRALHEANGVVFHLGRKVLGFADGRVGLDDGEAIAADFVVAGVGVAPRTALAERAGLKVDNGVVVDRWLRAGAPGVYAAGDIARYPDVRVDRAIRVEHWVHAERQGQHVARAILGDDAPYADAPFFWSAHYDATIRYAGHAEAFEAEQVEGSLEAEDAAVRYLEAGRATAVATVGRDLAALKAELDFES